MPPYGYVDAGRVLIDLSASLDGDPLAALLWVKEGGRKKITHVWVDPSVQRRGVGRLLIDAYKTHVTSKVTMAGPFSDAGRAFAKRIGATISR
jgi:ribosomal protein S18 acetylase RimI-like enzyme